MAETWRAVGLLTFTVIFILLALRPTTPPPLWLIVIANKLALVIVGLILGEPCPEHWKPPRGTGLLCWSSVPHLLPHWSRGVEDLKLSLVIIGSRSAAEGCKTFRKATRL